MEQPLFAAMDQILALWPYVVPLLNVVLSLLATGHAVLSKRDTRAAIGWVGVIWLAPILGVLLYVWLGINRIERRARSLRAERPRLDSSPGLGECPAEVPDQAGTLAGTPLEPLVKLVRDVTRRPLLAGNRVTPLVNGDQAYPAMLQAIDEASQSITLTTYIFDHDPAGQRFLEALRGAVSRHVEVRVLIDYVGAHYSWRPIARRLRRAGIPCAQFLPTLIPWRFHYSNLRSHRKILVVDGRIGFTGGINIHEGNCLERQPRHPVQDLHFRLTGPVVAQLQAVFADDWAFCTGELLQGQPWFSAVEPEGPVLARGIPDGPDDDFETLRLHAPRRDRLCTVFRAGRHALFPARRVVDCRLERGRPARRPGRHRLARGERIDAGAVGVDGTPVAGTGTRLPDLALAPAVRSHQTDAGRRTLDAPGLGQLGPPQPAAQFRVQRGVLRPRIGDVADRFGPRQDPAVAAAQPGGRGRTRPAPQTPRRGRTPVLALSVTGTVNLAGCAGT